MSVKTLAQLVEQGGRIVYGPRWRSRLARALDLNPRTVRKIAKAAECGEHYPVSPGVLTELAVLARDSARVLDSCDAEGRRQSQHCEAIASELVEAARTWKPTSQH